MKKFIGNFDIAVDGIRNIDGRNFHIVRILCYGDTNIEKEYYLTYSTIKELSDRVILVKILHFPEGSILNIKQGRIWKVTRKNAEKGEKNYGI